jgi:hypothetical protein
LLNVNREIYAANQDFLHALAEVLLDGDAADTYLAMPVSG